MAFAEGAARLFTATSILKNAPASSGVYALSNAREWIFIGEASDIRARLLAFPSDQAERQPRGRAEHDEALELDENPGAERDDPVDLRFDVFVGEIQVCAAALHDAL